MNSTFLKKIAVPVILIFGFFITQANPLVAHAQNSQAGAGAGANLGGTSVGGNATAGTGCTQAALFANNAHLNVFPLIPDSLRNGGDCPAPFWNIEVIRFFAFKALVLLNWTAATLAIILTIYGGLMYIMGAFSEESAKKAKAIIISAYVGVAIVVLARVILFGTLQLATGDNTFQIDSPPSNLLIP